MDVLYCEVGVLYLEVGVLYCEVGVLYWRGWDICAMCATLLVVAAVPMAYLYL